MRLVVLPGIDPSQVHRVVGAATFERGRRYARERRVVRTEWDGEAQRLSGEVRGSSGEDYETDVLFEPRGDGLRMVGGSCGCRVGFDCEHVAALVLVTAGPAPAGGQARPALARAAADPDDWERAFDSLLEPGRREAALAAERMALAIELSLVPVPGRDPKLSARLVRPGRSGWVGGGVSWSRLEQSYYTGEYRPGHVSLLRELYALHRARGSTLGYHYGEEKNLDLAAIDGARLWSLLDKAAAIGVRLVHARAALGDVAPPGHAELSLDVTGEGPAGGLSVATVTQVSTAGGQTVQNPAVVRFVGASGHGVVWVAGPAGAADLTHRQIGLARLATPAAPALQRMTLRGERMTVPHAARARFGSHFYPRLRSLAVLGSSDGSWTPPAISPPVLGLRASYGDDHVLDLHWEWIYQVDGVETRSPLAASESSESTEHAHRDRTAERAVLAALDYAGPRGSDGALTDRARLTGRDTMRFTTEVLPRLIGEPDVTVVVEGEPAHYRDTGDLLRITVSADEIDGQTDWFDLGIEVEVDGQRVPFGELFRALAAGEPELLLADGAWFSLDKPQLRALRELIEEARALQERPSDRLRISRFQAGLWDELAALGVVDRQAAAWREQVDGLLTLAQQPAPEPPASLRAQLRPYQRDGFTWLSFLWRHRLGGILADDMGLGKTVQTLALICHARAEQPDEPPFLVVAPTSVVPNWAAEAARFAPELRVVTIADTLRRRGQELADAIAGADLVVTTYTLLRLDVEAYTAATWSGVLLDEAQAVKNHQSKVYAGARRLPAPFKLAITGTPMENNLMELWSLLSITAPGLFPNPTRFREHYARPLERTSPDPELLTRLRRRIRPLVTRRAKEQVATELPAKQQQVLSVELDSRHRRLYQRHLQRERQKVLGLIDDVQRNRFAILRSLTLLRQLALHPGLIDEAHRDLGSAKIDTLVEHLAEVGRGGHRALVFSQFTGFLSLVRQRLDEAGVVYSYLDGATRNRAAVVERFKTGAAPVFLISLKAGGFGLNLTEADYVFLLDPWWNPATEAQAIDRTHRIGQTRTVLVYRLISADTIEEKVLALAARKAELTAGVMDEGNLFASTLAADDIRQLLA